MKVNSSAAIKLIAQQLS